MVDQDTKLRFLNKVYPEPNTGCWLWGAGLRGITGYGVFKFKGETIDSHRMSFQIFKGVIPDDKLVCHTCDVRTCVNPDHLFLCSYKENYHDAVRKNRIIQSSPLPESKWTHGIGATYDRGCRCEKCTTYKRISMKKYRQRVKELRVGQGVKSRASLA